MTQSMDGKTGMKEYITDPGDMCGVGCFTTACGEVAKAS
jgi:hypothetical protein